MDEFRNIGGYSFSWTQPYPSYGSFGYTPSAVDTELKLLDRIDRIVDAMTDYPQARELMERIQNDR